MEVIGNHHCHRTPSELLVAIETSEWEFRRNGDELIRRYCITFLRVEE
jgi:hypothetical protein